MVGCHKDPESECFECLRSQHRYCVKLKLIANSAYSLLFKKFIER